MTYNTKAEFMAALKSQAEKYSLSFGEMAEDFEPVSYTHLTLPTT